MVKILYCLLLCMPTALFAQKQVISQLKTDLPLHGEDSLQYADALNRLGLLYLSRQLDSSYYYAGEGYALSHRLRYNKGIADAGMNLGACFTLFHNNRLATRFYEDGLQRYRQLGDSAGICKALLCIGIRYHRDNRQNMAVPYINDAMAIGSRLLHDSARAPVLIGYYMVFAEDSFRQDSARLALRKSREIAGKYGDRQMIISTGLCLAREQVRAGKPGPAMKDLAVLAADAAKEGFLYLAASAYGQLDEYAAIYHLPDTIEYRRKMMQAAMDGGYRQMLIRPAAALYRYYRQQGPEAALPYADVLERISEDHEGIARQEGRSYLEGLLQEEERKAQRLSNALQQQNLVIASLESRNRNLLISFFVVCGLLLTGLIIMNFRLFHFTRRSTNRQEQLNRALNEKNRHLQHHDDFKNKLLSILAHDFRLPLGHIINASQLFAREDIRNDEMREISSSIASMATETLHLFESVLRWVKSQLAGFEYEPKPYLLHELWREVQEPMAGDVQARALRLSLNIPRELVVQADREMLQFVNRNLLHNAVKFSPDGGNITIDARPEDDRVIITVTNEGGIAAADIPFVFDYKIAGKYARETGRGAGIALIICKDFVERMGGSISVRSDGRSFTAFEYVI